MHTHKQTIVVYASTHIYVNACIFANQLCSHVVAISYTKVHYAMEVV